MSKKKQEEQREEKNWEQVDKAVITSERFVEKYQKEILYVISGIVVVICGFLAYKHFIIEPKNGEAQIAIYKGQQYFDDGKDSIALFGDANGYLGFEVIADTYGSTPAGNLAKAYAGICNARQGKYDKAINYLSDYSADDKLFSHQAKVTLADCYVNTGKLEDALKLYEKAAKSVENDLYSPIYYKKAAMVYREKKNYDKVIEIFTLIKNNYMNSAEAAEADKYIEEANMLKTTK